MAKPAVGATINPAHPLATGLALYVPLLEGSGDTIIDYVSAYNGTYGPVAAIWTTNADGPVLQFRHEDSSAVTWTSVPSALKANPLTVAVRVKRRGPTSSDFDGICGNTDSSSVGWQMVMSPTAALGGFADENWFVQTYGGGGGFGSGTQLVLDQWYTLVFTHNGTTIHTYVDGVEIGGGNAAAAISPATTQDLYLGRRVPGGNTFHSDIECFAIWSRALSGAEVVSFSADPYGVMGEVPEEPSDGVLEEYCGPYGGSYRYLKAYYGAVGDGIADDQPAVAAALAGLVAGEYKTLYCETGQYRMTAGAYAENTTTSGEYFNVVGLGATPADVRFFWDAAPFEYMAVLNIGGVHYSSFSRITVDGGGNAWAGIRFDGAKIDGNQVGYFPTGNELVDVKVHDCTSGVLLQRINDIGVSELKMKRCEIYNNTGIGVFTGGFNTLDIWLEDCYLHDNQIDIGNHDRNISGAGNFHAFRSRFERAADTSILIGNTQGHNFDLCTFVECNRVYDSYGISATNPTTFKRCTIIDTTMAIAISMANSGPLFFFHNTVRSLSPTETSYVAGAPVLVRGYNTYSSSGQAGSGNDYPIAPETVVARAALNPTLRPWMGHAPKVTRDIFEVPVGSSTATLQTAISNAVGAGPRAVVHIQGKLNTPPAVSIDATINVPVSDIQIVGDGRSSEVKWAGAAGGVMFHLLGPGNHATMRDLRLHGNDTATCVLADNADQPGGVVLMDQPFAEQCMVGFRFDHLADTKVELRGDGAGSTGVGVAAGSGVYISAAEVVQWGGAYGTNFDTSWTVTNGGRGAIFYAWYEGQPPEAVRLGVGSAFGGGFPSGIFVRWGGIEVAPDTNHAGDAGPDDATVHIEEFNGRVVYVGTGFGAVCKARRWTGRRDAPTLLLGCSGTLQPYWIDEQPNSRSVLAASYRISTAEEVPTYSIGTAVPISDVLNKVPSGQKLAFIREQLEWPLSLQMHDEWNTPFTDGVTRLAFSRVDVTRCVNGIDVRGTIPSLSGTPATADTMSRQVTWLVAESALAAFLKHAAFVDPLGANRVMPGLAASGTPGTRTHRWCRIRMTPLQQEELAARVAAEVTATTIKVYDTGQTPEAILSTNNLVKYFGA